MRQQIYMCAIVLGLSSQRNALDTWGWRFLAVKIIHLNDLVPKHVNFMYGSNPYMIIYLVLCLMVPMDAACA